jgi:hypothetical protein
MPKNKILADEQLNPKVTEIISNSNTSREEKLFKILDFWAILKISIIGLVFLEEMILTICCITILFSIKKPANKLLV